MTFKCDSTSPLNSKIGEFALSQQVLGGRYTEKGPLIDKSLGRLLTMLTYMRPARSLTEEEFIVNFIEPYDPWSDGYGNLWIQVGDNPEIMWSCHTDTIHHTAGIQRTVCFGPMVYADGSSCLGADDTVGVWLCLEMIQAGVEGLYIFHRDEEVGGGGSTYIANNYASTLKNIKFAIALDRKGYGDIITHQGGRCCSDAFANSLANILGGEYKADPTGIFTDTANYVGLIGECTNISVGYFRQHGPTEHVNLSFVEQLRDTLISADFSTLVSERNPGDFDEDFAWNNCGRDKYYGSYIRKSSCSLYDMIVDHPLEVADWLEKLGVTAEYLGSELGIDL